MSPILWIRSEIFDHGVFNTSIRWTVNQVFSFVASMRQHVSGDVITRAQWIDVSTTRCKPQLSEAEASAYWQVFSVLYQSIVGDSRDTLDMRSLGVLLLSQIFSRSSRQKNDMNSKSNEVWNERAVSSPRASPRGTLKASVSHVPLERGVDYSSALLSFVKAHISFYLQMVSNTLYSEPPTISLEEFEILGLILCAGTSKTQPVWKISEAVPELTSRSSMSLNDLKKHVQKVAVWNDVVYSHEQAKPVQEPSAKTLNIMALNKSTWFHRPHNAEIEYLNIVDCRECSIYVTARIRFCLISGCEGSTIILGGVSTLCTAHNCEKVSIHVAAHSFKMENCTDTSVFLYCHVPPILTGDSRGIEFGPYNVCHSHMGAVLQGSQMTLDAAFVDVWAHPICCTTGMLLDKSASGLTSAIHEDSKSMYHFVHPSKFSPVVVPENGPRSGPSQLCLPEVYDEAMKSRQEEMQQIHRQLQSISDDAAKKKAHEAIQNHFRDWLHTTGKNRQLADLARWASQFQS